MNKTPLFLTLLLFPACQDDNNLFKQQGGEIDDVRTELAQLRAQLGPSASTIGARLDALEQAQAAAGVKTASAELATSTEVTRAQAAETDLLKKLSSLMEPHLIGPKGEDLGRWLGPGVAFNYDLGAVIDYAAPLAVVRYAQADCMGQGAVSPGALQNGWPALNQNTAVNTYTGTIWLITAPANTDTTHSGFGSLKCVNGTDLGAAQPARDTKAADLSFKIDDLRVELRPALR